MLRDTIRVRVQVRDPYYGYGQEGLQGLKGQMGQSSSDWRKFKLKGGKMAFYPKLTTHLIKMIFNSFIADSWLKPVGFELGRCQQDPVGYNRRIQQEDPAGGSCRRIQ